MRTAVISIILLGLLVIGVYSTGQLSPDKTPQIQVFSPENNSTRTNQQPISVIYRDAEGPLQPLLKRNRTWIIENANWNAPITVTTNSKGLREEPFSAEKPSNTTRILVIGDSYVFGWGINASDRFSDVIEKRLNSNHDRRFQVINAAVAGWNLRHYYLFLREHGVAYDPDAVVIGMIHNDMMDEETRNQIHANATALIQERYPNSTQGEHNKERKDIIRQLKEEHFAEITVNKSNYRYLYRIDSLADAKNISDLYYVLDDIQPNLREFIDNFGDRMNETILYAPERFTNRQDMSYRVSEDDYHPSARGHRLLADTLYPRLLSILPQ